MTREETIKVLKASAIQQLGFAKIVVNGKALSVKEALNMVIKVLEQEPCEDCVSRKAVRDTIFAKCSGENLDIDFAKVMLLQRAIKAIPSVTPQEPKTEWIPVSERLPNDRDWYLGIFKESDTGWVNPLPFVCDYVGHETKATTKDYWILHGFTDMDECIDYYSNLECVAWQPLPKPYCEVNE